MGGNNDEIRKADYILLINFGRYAQTKRYKFTKCIYFITIYWFVPVNIETVVNENKHIENIPMKIIKKLK